MTDSSRRMNHAQCSWLTPKPFTIFTAKFPLSATATRRINASRPTSPTSSAVAIRTIRFCIRDHRNDEVPHFQHHAAWSDAIAFGSSGHRSDCSDVSRRKASRKRPVYSRTKRTWSRIAAARNITVQTLRHPVSCAIECLKFDLKCGIF